MNRSAEGAAFLVAVEVGAPCWAAVRNLALLVELLIGRQHVGPEHAEGVAVELDSPPDLVTRLMTPARAALVGGWRVLGFDARLVDGILGNIQAGMMAATLFSAMPSGLPSTM